MKIGTWAGLLAASALVAGCGDFWQAPSSGTTSFTLSSNPSSITVAQGASGTSTITVTPGSSFTGTVTLSCPVTNGPSGATSATDPTCTFTSSSLTFSSATTQTPTMTVDVSSSTPVGGYTFTVTGTSGSVAATTTVCVIVGSGSCTSTASSSGNFYILNNTSTPQIAGESIASGTVTAISGGSATLPVAGRAFSLAIAPNGKYLCVSTINGVFAYTISSSGALSNEVKVSPDPAYDIQIDTTDSWLVEAYQTNTGGPVTVGAVPINSATGANAGAEISQNISVPNAAVQPNGMVISKDNANVFLALGEGGTLVVPFSASAPLPNSVVTNSLIINVAHSGGSALSVAVDPGTSPRLFYIGEILGNSAGNSGGIRAFTYASLATPSALVQASGSPIPSGGLAPNFILPEASGGYVYVADGAAASTAGVVAGFTITGSSPYTIAADSTVTVGVLPLSLAEDSNNSYILEVGSNSPYFDAFSFNSSTGVLTSGITSTTAATNIAIVAAP